jgi:hypothetical protein
MNFLRMLGAALVASFCALSSTARAGLPSGTLVYHFTYSASQEITSRDSANSIETVAERMPNGDPVAGQVLTGQPTNGISHYGSSLSDKGTITVDIVERRPDGALVVMISEQGETIRRAGPARCIVYGNTNVNCESDRTVYTEEYTLLRFLAQNFVEPNQINAGNQWSIVQDVNDDHVNAKYAVNSNSGGQMQIAENRSIKEKGGGRLTTDIESSIGYDYAKALPTSVTEYAQQYTDAGIRGSQRTIYQTTLQLVSDTTAQM